MPRWIPGIEADEDPNHLTRDQQGDRHEEGPQGHDLEPWRPFRWWAMLDLNQRPLVCETNRSVNIYSNLQRCNPTVTPALVQQSVSTGRAGVFAVRLQPTAVETTS